MSLTSNTSLIYGYSIPLRRWGQTSTSSYFRCKTGWSSPVQWQNGVAVGFMPEASGTITKISFNVASITSSLSNILVGIMSPVLTGSSGSTAAYPSNTFLTYDTVSISNYGWNDYTLTTPYTATVGQMFFIAAKIDASTTGDLTFLVRESATGQQQWNHMAHKRPNSFYRLGTDTWAGTSGTVTNASGMAYLLDGMWYGAGTHCSSFTYTPVLTNGSDGYGFSFITASNHPDYRVKAIKTAINYGYAELSTIVKIYNSDGSLKYTFNTDSCAPVDPDTIAYVVNKTGQEMWLTGGQKYYILCELSGTPANPFGGTGWSSIINYSDPTKMSMIAGTAWSSYYVEKVNGVITEYTDKYCDFQLIIDQIRY